MMMVQSHHQQQPTYGSSSFSKNPINQDINPLGTDEELQSLLKVVKNIHSVGIFTRWYTTFMEKLNTVSTDLLEEEEAMDKARQANAVLLEKMKRMNTILQIISKVIKVYSKTHNNNNMPHDEEEDDNMEESFRSCRSKANNAINRLKEVCLSSTKLLQQRMVPNEKKKVGYNQFQSIAVMLTDGFEVYGHLLWQHDILEDIKDKLQFINDDDHAVVVVEAINTYQDQIRSICNNTIMSVCPNDHGLFHLVMKVREFAGDTSFENRANNMIELLLQQDDDDQEEEEEETQDDDDDDHPTLKDGSLPDLMPMRTTTKTNTASTPTTTTKFDEDLTSTTHDDDDELSHSEHLS